MALSLGDKINSSQKRIFPIMGEQNGPTVTSSGQAVLQQPGAVAEEGSEKGV